MKQNKPDTIKLTSIHLNDGTHGLPKNPRFIKDDRFRALCDSVRDNPEYMPARPIIVNEQGVILGGNMRYRACRELGMKDIPSPWVQHVEGWPIEKQKRFIILDNRGFGDDDMDMLANEWDISELLNGGFTEDQLDIKADDIEEGLTADGTEEFSEDLMLHHNYLVFYFDNMMDFQVACQKYGVQVVKSSDPCPKARKVGIGRVVKGTTLL